MSRPDDPSFHRLIDLATDAYARKLEDEVTSHPDTEVLIAYQEGRLEASEAEELRRHLVACSLCREALERLDAYDDDSDRDRRMGTTAVTTAEKSWASFRKRIATDTAEPSTGAGEETAAATRLPNKTWPVWVLAASVVFALAGAVSLFLTLQRDGISREARAAGGNPFIFDLFPDGQDANRSVPGIQVVDVPVGTDPIIPRLLLGDQTAYSSYSATLTGVSGETLWKQSSLTRQPSGGFALLIPRAAVPPGDYVLRLLGERDGAVRQLASYTFRLHYLE